MAITKTELNTSDYSVLAAWMQANIVPSYFSAVTFDSDTNVITCKNGSDTVLTIAKADNNLMTVTFYIDGSANVSRGFQYYQTVGTVCTAANGIIIHFNYAYTGKYGVDVLITKTNNGKIAAVLPSDGSSQAGTAAALYTGVRCCAWGDETTGSDISFVPANKNQTQLVPFGTYPALGTVSYTQNAFYVLSGQYYTIGIASIIIDSVTFLTNGYWAIKDE